MRTRDGPPVGASSGHQQKGSEVARISYVDPESVSDPALRAHLDRAAARGTPRPESQSIRAHVPAVLETFSQAWEQTFHQGVVDHRIKELCRVYVSKSIACDY